MKSNFSLSFVIILFFNLSVISKSFSQNQFNIRLEGLKTNDSATVIIQKSSEIYFKQLVVGNSASVNELKFSLSNGKWAINVDTKGYTFPPATAFDVPDVKSALVKLTPMLNKDFLYAWQDDDSYAGHATQVYVNEMSKLVVLDKTISVPSDYSSIKLRNEFGIVLSNDKSNWTSEDSYRLYSMFKTLPIRPLGEGSVVDFEHGENVKAIFYLTDQEQNKDMTIQNVDGVKYVTISQAAFTYANPQIGNLDGIKMKFYSKRLNHAVLNYFTDLGANEGNLDLVALERFGVRFMKSGQEVEVLMNEDASDFQNFFNEEKIEILSMFEELPEGFHKQEGLKYLVRRVNGQDHPKYPTASAIAWTGINTIEFMSKAFNGTEINSDVRRLILHEKSHFLWGFTFNEEIKKDWTTLGGWFVDPTSGSGWSTYNTTEFVSEYAHEKNPNEDMAESVATYILNPDLLLSRSVRKYEFIRDRIMHGTRYLAQIREDLTFTVFNLFPDYMYPGKIKEVKINVKGKPEEDKQVSFEFKLNSNKELTDGASVGYIRLASIIGTIHDVWLSPKNGSLDSILVGTTTFSKHEKNGYWNLVSLRVEDPVKNSRYENTSTIGFKLYIENPLEDIIPPRWKYDLKMELVEGNFDESGQNGPNNVIGKKMQAIKYSYSFYDKSPMNRCITRIFFPKLENTNAQIYEEQIQGRPIIDSIKSYKNDYNSLKHFEMYLGIPDYFPSGYYAVSMLNAGDIAENYSNVYMVEDTANFYIQPNVNKTFKDVRKSLYVKTPFPDYIAPEIDLNRIRISATPTNAISPDGETRVDISLLTRDLSDFPSHESGVKLIRYVLRDPLGVEHGYSSWNDNMLLDYYSLKPAGNSEWQLVNLNITLPKGSPPGKWGISSMQTLDRAGNFRNYSFVEIVRFDVIKSDVVLTEPLICEITNKLVNADNVDNIDVKIICKPGKGLNCVYTIYSLMGGNVVRGEEKMTGDEILIQGLNTQGVLDGIIKLTVQLTDSSSQLIATKTVEYTKDTQRPSAYYTRSNLQNQGYSNLDNLVFDIVLGNSEVGGNYLFKIEDTNPLNVNNSEIKLNGNITSEQIIPIKIDLSKFKNKIIRTTLSVSDKYLNTGNNVYNYFLIQGDSIMQIKLDSDKVPFAYAGSDLTVNEGALVNLDGSLSFDPNQDFLTYIWTAPLGIKLSSTSTVTPTFTAPEVKNDTILNFSLVVSDCILNSNQSTVKVLVKNMLKTGLKDMLSDRIKLYPNPTSGIFKIDGFPTNQTNQIAIYSIDGRLIRNQISNSLAETFDLRDQGAGVYVVLINGQPFKLLKD